MLNFLQCYFEVNKKLVIMQVTTRLSLQCLFMSSQCVTLGREIIEDNKSLAQFELKGIPQLPAGSARVEIEFIVNVDGILTVTAREKTTGIEQTVEINSSFGLSEADIQDMVNQSINNFDEDMKARSLAEAKINGNKLIHLVKAMIIFH